MKRFLCLLSCGVGVGACGILQAPEREVPNAGTMPDSAEVRPVERPEVRKPPPSDARTAEQFDTTTEEQRTAAVEAAQTASAERNLGRTIASLGDVTEPGIWMKTPLVSQPGKGRVDYPENGTSVVVDLIPLEGDPGAGSQLSLAAMRLLEADLTALPEVRVFQSSN